MNFFVCIIIVLILLLIIEIIRSYMYIQTTTECIELENLSPKFDGLKIVHLSDLHGRTFGKDNAKILKKIRNVNPDYIFCTGDMMDCGDVQEKSFAGLGAKLSKIAPCYYSIGNHESRLRAAGYLENFSNDMKKSGVIVLDNSSITLVRNEEKIILAGYTQPLNWNGDSKKIMHAKLKKITSNDIENVLKKQDECTILLAHDPEQFDEYEKWGADLVLSGHIHGGMWRIFGVGILSPYVKLFPKYHSGVYCKNKTKMFVHRGMSFSHIPRLFNPVQIAVIKLKNLGEKNEEKLI